MGSLSDVSFTDLILSDEEFLIKGAAGTDCRSPVPLTEEYHRDAQTLYEKAVEEHDDHPSGDFNLEHDGVHYRVTALETMESFRYVFRRPEDFIPRLEDYPVPDWIRERITARNFQKNGFVIVSGNTGSGKTTLAGSYFRTLLEQNGGYAVSIEDPPELALEGRDFGDDARFHQTEVKSSYAKAVARIKRTASPHYILLGECRDGETAVEAINAGLFGPLVTTTTHGSGIIETIQNFIGMVQNDNRDGTLERLSRCLNGILHVEKKEETNRRQVTPLLFKNIPNEHVVRQSLPGKDWGRIKSEVERQVDAMAHYRGA